MSWAEVLSRQCKEPIDIHVLFQVSRERIERTVDRCAIGVGSRWCPKRRQKRAPANTFDESVENQIEPSHQPGKPRSPDQQVFARQISRKVGEALESLPARQRTAFVLKNHQGLSIKEIAELMETAEGTVKVHLHRAVTALRERLAEFA